jgi:hypothetical protein
MGAWGADTFDNDTACDWSYALDEVADLNFVRETLARVLAVGKEIPLNGAMPSRTCGRALWHNKLMNSTGMSGGNQLSIIRAACPPPILAGYAWP